MGFDFAATGGPPVGLLFSFEVDPIIQAGDDVTERLLGVAGGLFYTGREDLGLGLEVTGVRAPQGYTGDFMTVIAVSTVMHYYF